MSCAIKCGSGTLQGSRWKYRCACDWSLGCPPPEEHISWLTIDGREVAATKEEAQFDKFIKKEILPTSAKDKFVFSDDPIAEDAKAFVKNYHIDTEIGLRLFADTIRKYNLHQT